jgi:hypothetical protein
LSNAVFHTRVGRFAAGIALLRNFGFEDAREDGAERRTHLALPTADASQLATGLVLLQASREALALVDSQLPQPSAGGDAAPAGGSLTAGSGGASYTRAEGKRPARPPALTVSTAPSAARPLPELADFTADGIHAFFALHAGEGCAVLATADSDGLYLQLRQRATEALRVASSTACAPAQTVAARWLRLLREHAALMGWRDGDEAGPAGAVSEGSGAEDEGEGEDEEAPLPPVGADGNFEACYECGIGGELICCEGCPNVFHAECLGPFAPPPDDDSDWYCPVCAKGLGM